MIFDAVPFESQDAVAASPFKRQALGSVVSYLEKKLGVSVVFKAQSFHFERPDLHDPLTKALLLQRLGMLKYFGPLPTFPDEPPLKLWSGVLADAKESPVGGAAVFDEAQAVTAMVAEATERYIWLEEHDYFDSPVVATTAQIQAKGPCIEPHRFTSFSSKQREKDSSLNLREDAQYLWIKARSLISGKNTYVPAQTVSHQRIVSRINKTGEPLIRLQMTNGLATWPAQAGARLRGALEVIERDAYSIMWLNHLTLPRIDLVRLGEKSPAIAKLLETCTRYRLNVHAVQLLTDAPTHAVCVVIEDIGTQRLLSFGLKAHRSLIFCIEKAFTEAHRARLAVRRGWENGETWDAARSLDEVGHYERVHYWAYPEHVKQLNFLIAGEIRDVPEAAWENDSEEEHLERIVAWCRAKGYEYVCVPLTASARNPTNWHIEMVIIPELQQMHLFEKLRALGGTRLTSIPSQFGYTPRAQPFLDAPHPFA